MPNIQKVTLTGKTIYGLETRTKNVDEMKNETQKIAPLWEQYHTEIVPNLEKDVTLYGVYHHYESDDKGAFDVLVGSESEGEGLASVRLEEGRYLKFPVKGEMPQAIIDTWSKVWAYFEDPSVDERRVYETDFEHYISVDAADIYIGVHYF
jgi:predicted transcriptional regulator YdeE